jgi:hypothetical protein
VYPVIELTILTRTGSQYGGYCHTADGILKVMELDGRGKFLCPGLSRIVPGREGTPGTHCHLSWYALSALHQQKSYLRSNSDPFRKLQAKTRRVQYKSPADHGRRNPTIRPLMTKLRRTSESLELSLVLLKPKCFGKMIEICAPRETTRCGLGEASFGQSGHSHRCHRLLEWTRISRLFQITW